MHPVHLETSSILVIALIAESCLLFYVNSHKYSKSQLSECIKTRGRLLDKLQSLLLFCFLFVCLFTKVWIGDSLFILSHTFMISMR